MQKHRYGIFTQSFPTFLALSLYQIESNTRSAAVLGFVGAGGIGLVYAENMRLWNWDVVMFITLILVVVVMIMDKVSSMLRNKYIIGEDIPLYQQKVKSIEKPLADPILPHIQVCHTIILELPLCWLHLRPGHIVNYAPGLTNCRRDATPIILGMGHFTMRTSPLDK